MMNLASRFATQVVRSVLGILIPEPPLELNALARHLGARDVLYLAQAMAGFTDFSGSAPVVYLAMSRSDGRRRFSLAHECGHLMLAHQGAAADVNVPPLPQGLDEELVCDAIAAELLLPGHWVRDKLVGVYGLEDLRTAAEDLRVSMAMLVTRLRHFGSDQSLLRLRRSPSGSWVIMERSAAPASWRGDLCLDRSTQDQLTSLPLGSQNCHVTLRTRTCIFEGEVEVLRQPATVLMLLRRSAIAYRAAEVEETQSRWEFPRASFDDQSVGYRANFVKSTSNSSSEGPVAELAEH